MSVHGRNRKERAINEKILQTIEYLIREKYRKRKKKLPARPALRKEALQIFKRYEKNPEGFPH